MDADAIRELFKFLSLDNVNFRLADTDSNAVQVALPSGFQIVDMEKYNQTPVRHRCHFETPVFDDFINYIKEKNSDMLMVTVQPEKMTAKAVFDFGTEEEPRWREDTACLSLVMSLPYQALSKYCGTTLGQEALIDFFEDYAAHIQFYEGLDDTTTLNFNESIVAIRNMRVTASSKADSIVNDFASAASKYDKIEADTINGTLPGGFRFLCEPYDNLEHEQNYPCQLRVIPNKDGPPSFRFRIKQREKLERETIEAFRTAIKEELGLPGVFCGNFV